MQTIAAGTALALIASCSGLDAYAQIAAVSSAAPAETAPAEVAAPSQGETADAAEAPDDSGRVTVTAQRRRPEYQLFRDLDSNDVCPIGFERVALGISCAEITYDVFGKDGKFLRRCNIPVFSVSEGRPFEYLAVTFKKFSCGGQSEKKNDLYEVEIEHLLNPRTSDGTVFRRVSLLGYQQAKALCEASKDLCVLHLFDHRDQLTSRALKGEVMGGPPVPTWAQDDLRDNDDEDLSYRSFADELETMFEREGDR